jgi:hypothetical protein
MPSNPHAEAGEQREENKKVPSNVEVRQSAPTLGTTTLMVMAIVSLTISSAQDQLHVMYDGKAILFHHMNLYWIIF